MSTSAVVAVRTTDGGYQGRWIDSDGMPSGAGVSICELVTKHGVQRVREELVLAPREWSYLGETVNPSLYARNTYHLSEFGAAYRDSHVANVFVTQDDADSRWVYILEDEGVRVLDRYDGVTVSVVDYADTATMKRLG